MRVLRFTAPWCAPCKQVAPIVDVAAAEAGLALEVIDIEQEPERAMQYRVVGVPTVMVVDEDGAELMRQVGSRPARVYQQAFRDLRA